MSLSHLNQLKNVYVMTGKMKFFTIAQKTVNRKANEMNLMLNLTDHE